MYTTALLYDFTLSLSNLPVVSSLFLNQPRRRLFRFLFPASTLVLYSFAPQRTRRSTDYEAKLSFSLGDSKDFSAKETSGQPLEE